MLDHDAGETDPPKTQLESDGDGAGRAPRKTAVGSSGSGPKRWVTAAEAQKSEPVPYESVFEMLQVEDGANFEIMSRAHKFLYHELDTSFFTPSARNIKQQELLNKIWNGWCRSPECQRSKTEEKIFAKRALGDLNYYQVFQVLPTAKTAIIEAAYDYLERLYHPNNLGTGDDTKHKIVNEAWLVLGEPSTRKEYDKSLKRQ